MNASTGIAPLMPVAGHGDTVADLAEFPASAPLRHVSPGATIALHGQRADFIYLVRSGTARCCTITENGQRHIFRFARSGEFLGLAELETWHFTAEAIDHVDVRAIPREAFERARRESPALDRQVRTQVARELQQREQQLLLLAYARAEDRMIWFLRGFARADGGYTLLPMNRRDIADHLGMTHETVSRTLTALKAKGVIEMRGIERFRLRRDCQSRAA